LAERLANTFDHPHRKQGVSAELKERIVYANSIRSQQFLPDLQKLPFDFIPRIG